MRGFEGPNNQSGVAGVLMTVAISFVIVTTLSTIYVYLVNRAKHQGRIREARQMITIMESLTKVAKSAYEAYEAATMANGGTPDCPGSQTIHTMPGGMRICLSASGMGSTLGTDPSTCLGIEYSGTRYCVVNFQPASMHPFAKLELKPESHENLSRWERWALKMNQFYMTELDKDITRVASNITPLETRKLSNYLNPLNSARAAVQVHSALCPGSPPCTVYDVFYPDNKRAGIRNINCASAGLADPGYKDICERCGGGGAGDSGCFSIVTCSQAMPNCLGYGSTGFEFVQVIKIKRTQ